MGHEFILTTTTDVSIYQGMVSHHLMFCPPFFIFLSLHFFSVNQSTCCDGWARDLFSFLFIFSDDPIPSFRRLFNSSLHIKGILDHLSSFYC